MQIHIYILNVDNLSICKQMLFKQSMLIQQTKIPLKRFPCSKLVNKYNYWKEKVEIRLLYGKQVN